MYTEPQNLQAELLRRAKDPQLASAVLEFLDGALPEGWPKDGRPVATINRYVATARVEDVLFMHVAHRMGLVPFWPTRLVERFTFTNPEKVSCLKPRVQLPKLQASRDWLVADHKLLVGIPLGNIRVGQLELSQLHQIARRKVLGDDIAANSFDVSEWQNQQAWRIRAAKDSPRLAPFYYDAIMALYIRHGVMFEDFDGGPNAKTGLGAFVQEVVRPAFQRVTAHFGMPPLIVRLPWAPGLLDYPPSCAEIFERHREEQVPRQRRVFG